MAATVRQWDDPGMSTHGRPPKGTHAWYERQEHVGDRLSWLRAAVLGANDGIVSVAAIVIGVAGATSARQAIVVAGLAGLSAGAMSMAVGEYVSVSAQRDTEQGMLGLEQSELAAMPEAELRELEGLLRQRGLSEKTARTAARELTDHDALAAHARVELDIDPGHERANPVSAAVASLGSFITGGLIPFLAVLLAPHSAAVVVTVAGVVVALAVTGIISARLGRADVRTAVLRNVTGGLFAMGVTYLIGHLFGTALT